MPLATTITGSFTRHGKPIQGVLVRFTPIRLWVITDGVAWATLAPVARLGAAGSFTVQVTPTDIDSVPWCYQVDSPAGRFLIKVPWSDTGYTLKELIHEHRAGPRTTQR